MDGYVGGYSETGAKDGATQWRSAFVARHGEPHQEARTQHSKSLAESGCGFYRRYQIGAKNIPNFVGPLCAICWT
jgi:hypothetical protein